MTVEDQKSMLEQTISKNERTSWLRKKKNIEKLVEELEPLEEEIMKKLTRKTKIIDKIVLIRKTMVAECIHPSEDLTESADGTHLTCKFCERDISVIDRSNKD